LPQAAAAAGGSRTGGAQAGETGRQGARGEGPQQKKVRARWREVARGGSGAREGGI